MQLVSGVTGPLLDIFYVRTGMTRQVNVATKAAAQVLGHLTKVTYFAALVGNPAGRDLEQWLVMAYAACFAVLGTTLSRSFLDRMSDKQFYHWTRRVILALGAVYVAQGVWLMATPMTDPKKVDAKAEVRALLDRLPDDCTFADVQRGIAVLMWPKQGRRQPQAAASAWQPEEVKRRLREWLKSEKDK